MRRNGTIDIARLVAAWGIVAFHAGGPGAAIGYAGLPFFLILLIAFAKPAARDMDLRTFARSRAHRLLQPWLIWSAVYGGLKLLEAAVTGRPLLEEFDAAMILTGPALHLWFLPFAFAVSLALYPVLRFAGTGAGDAACAVAVAAGLALTALHQDLTVSAPLAQWLFAAPAVCLGLALALCRGRILLQGAIYAAVAGSALAAGWTAGAPQLAVAGGAFVLCSLCPMPPTALSRWAAGAAMGVYLIHPLCLSVLDRVTPLAEASGGLTLAACLCATLLASRPDRLIGSALLRIRTAPSDPAEIAGW